MRNIFNASTFTNLEDKSFKFAMDNRIINVDTSLDISLQQFLLSKIDRLKKINRGKPRYLAIVAVEPSTGRVISMASFDKNHPENNHCISGEFPAASIFKIVTASAAVDACGMTPESRIDYNGGKYTLYKSQLKNRKNRYTNRVSLKQSFAQSINPVFGKLGAHKLGKNVLEEYAGAFGFNREIDFELPLSPSIFSISDTPYQWAEIASGFNRETLISPIHSALLGAAILNSGRLIEPTIIDLIKDENGKVLYKNQVNTICSALSSDASLAIKSLMHSTIKSGTARKAFRGYRRDRILSKLKIGGKTGSISNKKRNLRYDWFVGFAEEKNGSKQMAISIVVAHEKYLGTRASDYARLAMKEYFKNYYAQNRKPVKKAHRS